MQQRLKVEPSVDRTESHLLSEYLSKLDSENISEQSTLKITIDEVKKRPQLQIDIPTVNEGTLQDENKYNLDVSPQTADAESPLEIKTPQTESLPSPDFQFLHFSTEECEEKNNVHASAELKVLQVILGKKSESDVSSPISSSITPVSPSFASLAYGLGYSGRGHKLRSFQRIRDDKLDPMIYWEQKTNIAFCSLNVDFEAVNKKFYSNAETLYDVYKRMISEHENPAVYSYPFDQWFQLYMECLPEHHIFKNYYLQGNADNLFTLTTLDAKMKAQCEMKFHDGKAYVRGGHPNKPYHISEINQDQPLELQWLLLDTTLLSTKTLDEKKEFLLEHSAKVSNRDDNKMIYVKNITENKIYVIFDQPGKIYHSTFINKLFNEKGFRLPEDDYDGGTLVCKNGVILHVENDSGHIRSSKDNFLHHGLCKNIFEANAHYKVQSLVIHYNNQNKANEVLRMTGSQVANFISEERLFLENSKPTMHSPFEHCVVKIKNKHQKKRVYRDSLTLKKLNSTHDEIIVLIGKRILEILEKKLHCNDIMCAEKKFLEDILKKYYGAHKHDLRKAAYAATKTLSQKMLQKIISNKNSLFYRTKNPTRIILKKIDALAEKGASHILKK